MVTFASEEGLKKFRSVRNQRFGKVVYGGDGKHGVLPDVGMSMLQAGSGRRKERLNQLGLPKLAQKSEGIAPDVLVGMLQIVTNAIAWNISALNTMTQGSHD